MAETELNIVINAAGGDQARDEILKASDALSQTSSSSARLQEQFQHRFQHIGLMLFAGDALRASGLGAETRQIITGLNLALTAGAEAFGVAAGPAFLLVAALAAMAGIAVKVIEHQKDQTDSLLKLADQQHKSAESTDKEVAALRAWRDAAGQLPPNLERLLEADERLRQQQIKSTETTNQQVIASLNLRIAKEADLVASEKATTEELQKGMAHLEQFLKPGMEGYTMLERQTRAYQASVKNLQTDTLKLSTDQAQLNRTISDQISLLHGSTKALQDQSAAAIKAANDRLAATQKEASRERTIMDQRIQQFIDGEHAMTAAHDEELKKQSAMTEKIAKKMTADFATAFQQTLFEGVDFAKAFEDAMINMIEHIIVEVLALIAVWSVLDIVTGGITGNPVTAGGIGSMKDFVMGGVGWGGKKALGGTSIVDKPTLFMAGEAGPEMASFTPLAAMGQGGTSGSGGGGGDTYIGPITVTANGVTDPKKLADIVGQEIVRSIRGQGQLNFSRNS